MKNCSRTVILFLQEAGKDYDVGEYPNESE